MFSLNDRLILEQYKKEAIRAEIKGGIARMGHKAALKPLKVLVDAKLKDGTLVPAGSTAYVREEHLFLNSTAGRHGDAPIPALSNEAISAEPFIILDLSKVEVLDILDKNPNLHKSNPIGAF